MKYDGSTQLRTLFLIKLYIDKRGYSPTLDDLACLRGLSATAIRKHVRHLRALGYLERPTRQAWRNIRLTDKGRAA